MPQARDEAGNIWEIDAQGNPVRLLQAAQTQSQQPPADPTFDYKGPKAAADLANTQTNTRRTAAEIANDAARLKLERDKLIADQANKGLQPDGRGGWAPIPGWKPDAPAGEENKQAQKNANLDALVNQINRVQDLYNKGLREEPYSILSSIADYLPTSENRQFDTAASGLAEQGLAAFRVPGVGAQSDTELRQFVEANKPSASDFDTSIEEKLLQLRSRVDATRKNLGLPPAQWQGLTQQGQKQEGMGAMPAPAMGDGGGGSGGGGGPSAWDNLYLTQDSGQSAGFGAKTTLDKLPPEYSAALSQYMAGKVANGGFLDPREFAQFKFNLDHQIFGTAVDQRDKDEAWANLYNNSLKSERAQTGGQGGDIPLPTGVERPMSSAEQLRNNTSLAAAPVIGAANAVTMGGVEALAPEGMAALRTSDNPYVKYGELGGEVAGTIYGAGKMGRLGEAVARAALPARLAVKTLRGGGELGVFGRNLATDAAYGAGYGTVTEGDPIKGAAMASVGSAGGQAVGKTLGSVIKGVTVSPVVQRLRDAGIPLTTGQTLGSGFKTVEDKLTSVPVVGDMVRARRLEGMRGFNEAAFKEAGAPVGYVPRTTGEPGLAELNDAIGKSYDNATAGVSVPLDAQIAQDLRAAMAKGQNLPDDLKQKIELALKDRVAPALDSGSLSGGDYQQAVRGLKGFKAEATRPGFEERYREVLGGAQDALTEQMKRGGGASVVEGLNASNKAYGGYKTLRDAVGRGLGGTQSGEVELFTPSQLQNAGKATERKFGSRPFSDLADAGQQVLPSKIPDSGTAGRLAQYALPGLLAGGSAAGMATDNPAVDTASGAARGTLTVGALLALLGTRRGQLLLNAAMTNRGQGARTVGDIILRSSPMVGTGAVPLMLNQ